MTKMTVSKWYGRSVKVPSYYESNYNGFLVSCLGIVRSVVERNLKQSIAIRFVNTGTASADQDMGLININHEYVKGNFNLPTGRVDSDTTLAAILGIIVHEAAHFAWSPATLTPFAEYVRDHTTCFYSERLAAILGNIAEDIFIEAEVGRSVPSLSWMLDSVNDLLFPDEVQYKAVQAVEGIESAPEDVLGVIKVFDLLLLAKLNDSVPGNDYIQSLFAEIRTATELFLLEDRKQLVLSIYEQVMCKVQEEDGEGGSGESIAIGALEAKVKGLVRNLAEERHEAYEPITRRLNRELSELENMEIDLIPDNPSAQGYVFQPTEVFIEKTPLLHTPIEMDARYQRLAEVGRQRAVVNRPYGEQRNRGTHIRNLHRIATDSRIFAEPLVMNDYKPMEVIILIDASGSMVHELEGSKESRIEAASKAALGAVYGLVNARCDVSVYAHTAELMGGTEVIIYRLKTFSESINVVAPRLGQMLVEQSFSQNRDGYAISHIAKKFQDKRKRRLLIVISDGQPWASKGYQGNEAIEHTRDVVNKVRQQGIDVLSISITEDARGTNNTIYGSQHNVFNEDPNVIEDVIRTLIAK